MEPQATSGPLAAQCSDSTTPESPQHRPINALTFFSSYHRPASMPCGASHTLPRIPPRAREVIPQHVSFIQFSDLKAMPLVLDISILGKGFRLPALIPVSESIDWNLGTSVHAEINLGRGCNLLAHARKQACK